MQMSPSALYNLHFPQKSVCEVLATIKSRKTTLDDVASPFSLFLVLFANISTKISPSHFPNLSVGFLRFPRYWRDVSRLGYVLLIFVNFRNRAFICSKNHNNRLCERRERVCQSWRFQFGTAHTASWCSELVRRPTQVELRFNKQILSELAHSKIPNFDELVLGAQATDSDNFWCKWKLCFWSLWILLWYRPTEKRRTGILENVKNQRSNLGSRLVRFWSKSR